MKREKSMKSALLVLPIGLALAAVDLPATEVQVAGTSTTTLDPITGTAPDTLVSKTVFIPASGGELWDCAVTASADTLNPLNGDNNLYTFGLNVDTSASTRAGSERTIDYDSLNLDEETNRQEVSSTYIFGLLSANANHTFYWSARKFDAGDADMTVAKSSMTIVCSDL